MLRCRWASESGTAGVAVDSTCQDKAVTNGAKHLKWNDIDEWRKDNEHIHSGYLVTLDSWSSAWLSLFGGVHNETINVLSHLFGAVVVGGVFLYTYKHLALPDMFGKHPHWSLTSRPEATLPYLLYPFKSQHIPVTFMDSLAFASFYLSACICFGCSATFHTGLCLSESIAARFNKLDYVGIVFLITGTLYPAIYYAFYCQPIVQALYFIGVSAFAAVTTFFVVSPGYTSSAYRRTRTNLFTALGMSGVLLCSHLIVTHGLAWTREGFALDWFVFGGACYIKAGVLYAEQLPERLRPGKHDLYGNSHQILHVMCLVAATSHYIALCKVFEYRHYVAKGC